MLLTAAPAVRAWEVSTESVTTITSRSSNIATIWGYHQPMIVRSGERVYCALLEPHGEGFAQHWCLYERTSSGWRRAWSSPQRGTLNQPPSIVADTKGGIHVFAWPDGRFTHWHFVATADTGIAPEPAVDHPPTPYDDLWPYAAVAVNAADELLAVASSYPENVYAMRATDGDWRRGAVYRHPDRADSPSRYERQAYPHVALEGRAAHVFTTEDIADSAKIRAGASFTYSFRNLQYFYTPDILSQAFARTTVVDVEGTGGWVHNDDLLVDGSGTVHLLYQVQTQEGDWPGTRTVHAFGPPGGPLRTVDLGRPGEFNSGRLWESPEGTVYTVQPRYTDLHVAAFGPDGALGEVPQNLDLTSTGWNYYGRSFLVNDRSSARGAPYLEGLYFVQLAEGQSEVRYFRATPLPTTAVGGDPRPVAADVRLHPAYPNPFNASASISFEVPRAERVRLDVIDPLGRTARSLVDGVLAPGAHGAIWDGTDETGRSVGSGVYLVRLSTADGVRCTRVAYTK